ncbi:MAG: hypothetical protein A3I61_04990 [Acidobacteria bacterium RIFCSPLOWO2_02_FULL_68_18]|nr:MAG: hypothetical protein A3I61_04990 [Acidobacteria bacterium RIFCSPLOWO2_02_FULL_68_18]OFW49097.1 MAG: hypothetical protein A3G77_10040 [Acidobacteria bacterium RIFCSPLOWO2_12_FULL_68_19]
MSVLEWLGNTPWSVALHESRYVFLVVLTVHVLTLTVLVGTAVMIDLRLLGVVMTRVPVSEVMSRLLPWSGVGFAVMLASGALLFYAAPLLRYQNVFFRLKMAALLLAVANAWLFHHTVYRRIGQWDRERVPPDQARAAAVVSLALWAITISAGRMMAYQDYWFD